jgi:mannose-6-phosphate isomerase-like protein (cupin superfamily)
MSPISKIDATRFVFDIHRDLSVVPREKKPGPPARIDGMTMGIEMIRQDPPHGGEIHPDGDEILYVVSGRIRVRPERAPDESLELGPGDACIVHKGEWHLVTTLEPTLLIHVTPGPRGDHRPVGYVP